MLETSSSEGSGKWGQQPGGKDWQRKILNTMKVSRMLETLATFFQCFKYIHIFSKALVTSIYIYICLCKHQECVILLYKIFLRAGEGCRLQGGQNLQFVHGNVFFIEIYRWISIGDNLYVSTISWIWMPSLNPNSQLYF